MSVATHTIAVPDTPGVWLAVDEGRPAREQPRAEVIFLPGFGSIRRGEKATLLMRELPAAGYRFLALDYEGHGDSTGDFGTLTLGRHLRDYRLVRDVLVGPAPHVLIGSSLGGLVAALAATRWPDSISALVLIAPAFGFRERYEQKIGAAALAEWQRAGTRFFQGEHFSVDLDYALFEEARRLDEERVIRSVDCPTLVLHGVADETVPVAESDRFVRLCRAPVRYERIERGSHRLEHHLPRLTAAILSFLHEVSGEGQGPERYNPGS